MSVPARRVPSVPAARSSRRPVPDRREHAPERRGPERRPSTDAHSRRRLRRRQHHLGFAVLSAFVAGSMVFGIVVLNVLLAQASFRIDEAERQIDALAQEHLELVREQATLSAPGRIAAWASRHGMRLPDDIRILHAPGEGSADPAGADPNTSTTVATEEDGR